MSSSFYFKCNKCQEIGGQYTRQAWGWGNFYVITSFKFLAFHTEHCGPGSISVVSENDIDVNVFNLKNDLDFLQKTKDYFPAFETQFDGKNLNEMEREELKERWYTQELEELKRLAESSFPEENSNEHP